MTSSDRNLTVPERTERVEPRDLEIKTLGPARFDSPLKARLGAAALHPVGQAGRVLLDDRHLKRSGDGSIIRDEIEAKFAADETSDAVRAIVRSLLGEAVERHATQS